LNAGKALSPDFTGAGWSSQPDFPPAPVYTGGEAGRRLASLSTEYDLSWFDYWLSDYAGHRGTLDQAVKLLESFDEVLSGLLDGWDLSQDLIVLTSDHGNLEDLQARGHTENPVPLLLVGPRYLRDRFLKGPLDLTSFYDGVLRSMFDEGGSDEEMTA
jgi:hypothetical protein